MTWLHTARSTGAVRVRADVHRQVQASVVPGCAHQPVRQARCSSAMVSPARMVARA